MKKDFYFTILCIWLRVLVITGVPKRPNGSPFFSKKKITNFFANSKDFMKIYEEESEGMLKSKARMSFAALYPKSFEKQKIFSFGFHLQPKCKLKKTIVSLTRASLYAFK